MYNMNNRFNNECFNSQNDFGVDNINSSFLKIRIHNFIYFTKFIDFMFVFIMNTLNTITFLLCYYLFYYGQNSKKILNY